MTHRTAVLVAAIVVQLLAGLHPAHAVGCNGEPDAGPPTFCGETVIRGNQPGRTRLTLPSAAEIVFNPERAESTVSIEGGMPFAGLAVVQDTPGRDGIGFFTGRYIGGPLVDPIPYAAYSFSPSTDDTLSLPAGDYLLYLLTPAGVQAEATIRISGLPGSRVVAPADPADIRIHSLAARNPGGTAQRHVFWTGRNEALTAPGFVFYAMGVNLSIGLMAGELGTCVYTSNPQPEDLAYAPRCPLTSAFPGTASASQPMSSGYSARTERFVARQPAGPYGLGGWYASVIPATDTGALGVWVSLT